MNVMILTISAFYLVVDFSREACSLDDLRSTCFLVNVVVLNVPPFVEEPTRIGGVSDTAWSSRYLSTLHDFSAC